MLKKLRVLVVDDHPLMREAVCLALAVGPDLEVAGQASGGRQAVELARTLQPDVIVMDLLMPGMDGVAAIAALTAENPAARILAFTSSTEETKVLEAVRAGALGYLLKDAERDEIITAIREVGQGRVYLPPTAAAYLVQGVRHLSAGPAAPVEPPAPAVPHVAGITERQQAVLALLGRGLSNAEIGAELSLSENTVRSHIAHILDRLALKTRSQAVAYAVERRLMGPPAD